MSGVMSRVALSMDRYKVMGDDLKVTAGLRDMNSQ